ncbi:metal-dependent hydrolase [Candidatus Woesearchaeota archaeon]|nr:metal-dependent hydrolase [Candidatus Woesearchaeota archaeon]
MATAVGHLIITMVLVELVCNYLLKLKLSRRMILAGGIAGLLPDLDIPLAWGLSWLTGERVYLHGGILHTLLPVLLSALVALALWNKRVPRSVRIIAAIIPAALLLHLALDCAYGGYATLLFPLHTGNVCPQWDTSKYLLETDAIMLVAWLIIEDIRRKGK